MPFDQDVLRSLRLAGWHYTQGVKTLRLKTERLGWISRTLPYRVEGRGRQCKTLQDTARLCKEREVILSEFAGA